MENLCFDKESRFDKEGYFHVLVFYGLFYKRNKKYFPHVLIRYRNTGESLGELEIVGKYSANGPVFPLQFLVLSNFHWCFYNCTKTPKMYIFYFLNVS